jgi:hypothetical protein
LTWNDLSAASQMWTRDNIHFTVTYYIGFILSLTVKFMYEGIEGKVGKYVKQAIYTG